MSPELDEPGEWLRMATVQEYLDAYDRQLRTDAETPSAVAVTRLGPLRLVTFANRVLARFGLSKRRDSRRRLGKSLLRVCRFSLDWVSAAQPAMWVTQIAGAFITGSDVLMDGCVTASYFFGELPG